MNDMKKEYVVTFPTSRQISEDSWQVFNPSLKVTGETTVTEIETFFRCHLNTGIMQVQLIELETLINQPPSL